MTPSGPLVLMAANMLGKKFCRWKYILGDETSNSSKTVVKSERWLQNMKFVAQRTLLATILIALQHWSPLTQEGQWGKVL